MESYDPNIAPLPTDWLVTDEAERINLVTDYHQREKISLPNAQLHALIHVVLENQIAAEEAVVVKTLARLRREGLDRHDALHAIGSKLAEYLYALMQEDQRATSEPYRKYLDAVQQLSASQWRNG